MSQPVDYRRILVAYLGHVVRLGWDDHLDPDGIGPALSPLENAALLEAAEEADPGGTPYWRRKRRLAIAKLKEQK